MNPKRLLDLARGRAEDKPKTDPLRYCMMLPDFSGVQSDGKGWFIYPDAETLVNACQTTGGVPLTVEAAEHIVKLNADLAEIRDRAATLQTQLDRAIQQSRFTANKTAQIVKERDDALKRIEQLEKTIQSAIAQLHHSYNDAPDWLDGDAHGTIKRAAIELRDALAK